VRKEVLASFAATGAEVVPELLPRSEMRRALVALGLVAWRAALPAGTWGWVVRLVAHPTAGPLLLLPVLLVVVAPVASIGSGALGAAAVYVAAGGMTWLHLPIALAISGSVGVLVWQKRARSTAWDTTALPPDPGRTERAVHWVREHAGRVAALAVAAALLLVLWRLANGSTSSGGSWQGDQLVTIAALAGLSALLPVFYIAAGSGMKGIRQWSMTSVGAALLVAVCAGAAAAVLAQLRAPGAWAAARGLYGAMGVTLVALYGWLHVSAVRMRRQPEAGSA
jgi:hypothetical protein